MSAVPSLPPVTSSTSQPTLVDCRGMSCPAPILATAKSAKALGNRQGTLVVVADDPAFPLDIKSWCRSTGHDLVDLRVRSDGFHQATVRVGTSPSQRAAPPDIAAPPPSSRRPHEVPREAPKNEVRPSSSGALAANARLDCRGMSCPQPIVTVARAVKTAVPGSLLEVIADDAAFPMDIAAWSRTAGVELVVLDEVRPPYRACLRVPGAASAPAPAPKPREVAESSVRPRLREPSPPASTRSTLTFIDPAPLAPVAPVAPVAQPSPSAAVTRDTNEARAMVPAPEDRRCSLLVLHNDYEALLAALLVANGAAASGMDVSIFFTFWGLNLLRGDQPNPDQPKEKVSFIQRLFKWLMPKGAKRQKLGKMNFGGAGKGMMDAIMRSQNLMMLPELLEGAEDAGVEFIACTMSMGVMGITKRDLRPSPSLKFGGVAAFIERSRGSSIHLVF